MKIKSTVWYWLAVASGAAGLITGMGLEGSVQVTDTVWMDGFVAALVPILAAILFARLGFAAEDREKAAKPRRYGKITRSHARNAEYPQDEERGA